MINISRLLTRTNRGLYTWLPLCTSCVVHVMHLLVIDWWPPQPKYLHEVQKLSNVQWVVGYFSLQRVQQDKGGGIRRSLWYGTGTVSLLWCIWPNHASLGGSSHWTGTQYLCATGWTFTRWEKGCCSFSSNTAKSNIFLEGFPQGLWDISSYSSNYQFSTTHFAKCKI